MLSKFASPLQAYFQGRESLLAILALIGTTLLWGTSFVAGKVVLEVIPPLTLAFLRFLIALAVLVPLLRRRGLQPIIGRDAALLGLTGMALFFIFQNFGLRLTGATDATLINNGAFPVLTALLAAALLKERLGGRLLQGLIVSIGGVAVVSLANPEFGFTVLGDSLILASVACGALYVVLGRRSFATANWLAMLVGAMAYGALFLFPVAVAETATTGFSMPGVDTILLLIYLGVGCSALAFALWAYAIKRLDAAQVGVIGNLEVPVGIAASMILLGEGLTPARVVGTLFIMGGAWLAMERTSLGTPVQELTLPDVTAPVVADAN